VYPLAVPLGLIAAHVFVVRVFEGGSWAYVRLDRRAARREPVASGALFGATAIGLPALALLAAGYLAVVAAPPGSSLMAAAYMAWILVPAALGEELLARGYVFALLRESWGWQPALVVTSAAFGLLHLANPGSNPQAILNVVLAGFFLGLVLIRFASLYAAWAAHAGWNLVLAAVLHTDVSGLGIGPTPDYRVIDSGPDWLTGGAWGPEGGAAAALGLAVASIILLRPLVRDARAAAVAAQQTNETDNAT
jgi:uncharacterized protein